MRLIFDGHLDLALFALAYNRDQTESAATINQREAGMTDVPERRGRVPTDEEVRHNPRARSARLRWGVRTAAPLPEAA